MLLMWLYNTTRGIMNFDIDIAMFLIFLAVTLFVGLRYSRDIKNIKDYALGGRDFSTVAIVATILATWIGGKSFAKWRNIGRSEYGPFCVPN